MCQELGDRPYDVVSGDVRSLDSVSEVGSQTLSPLGAGHTNEDKYKAVGTPRVQALPRGVYIPVIKDSALKSTSQRVPPAVRPSSALSASLIWGIPLDFSSVCQHLRGSKALTERVTDPVMLPSSLLCSSSSSYTHTHTHTHTHTQSRQAHTHTHTHTHTHSHVRLRNTACVLIYNTRRETAVNTGWQFV